MKQKKEVRSLFQFLVQKPWWVSMVGAVLFTLGFGALFPPEKRLLGIAAGLPFLIVGLIAAWRQWTGPSAAKIASMQEKALSMSWPEFSAHLTRAFQSNGFQVKPYAGKGADFEIIKPGKHLLVACKRWKAANVGVDPLRELQAAAEAKGLRGMLLTMGRISPAAFEYAAQERLDLMDADGVAMLLASVK
jgi:restriction system protein